MSRSASRLRRSAPVGLMVLVALVAPACGNRRPLGEMTGFRDVRSAVGEEFAAVPAPAVPGGPATGAPVDTGGSGTGVAVEAAPGSRPGPSAARLPGAPVVPGSGPDRGSAPATPGPAGPAIAAAPAATPSAPREAGRPAPGAGAAPAVGPARYDPGASATTIKFGSVNALTGLAADLFQPRGARAAMKLQNAKGGVNGRQLELLIYDDQWDSTRHAALIRQAVESDQVLAFVSNQGALTSHAARPYVEKHGIPIIGGDLIDFNSWGESPMYYPQSYLESVTGGRLAGQYAAELGCQRVAGFAFGPNTDQSLLWRDNFERGLKDRGAPGLVYSVHIHVAETDYSLYVSEAKRHNADCLTMGASGEFFVRLYKTQRQQNFFPRWIMPSSLYDRLYLDSLSADDHAKNPAYAVVQYDIVEDKATNPAVAEFVRAADAFEPGMKKNGYALLSWMAARIAIQAVERMGDNLTRANLIQVLDGMRGIDTGLGTPVDFGPGPKPGPRCANIIQVRDTQFTVVQKNFCLR